MSHFEVGEYWLKRPFLPFRLHVMGGTVHEIRFPEACMVCTSSTIVGHGSNDGKTPFERMTRVDNNQIEKIEPIGGNPLPSDEFMIA